MAKKKKAKPVKDRRFGINKVVDEMHRAYDFIEECSLSAIEKTLREEFGFGAIRLDRFKEAYLLNFGESTANKVVELRAELDKKRRNM